MRWLTGEPIQARRTSYFYRLRKRVRKHKAAAWGTLCGAILILGAGFFSLMRTHEQGQKRGDEQGTKRVHTALEFSNRGFAYFQKRDFDRAIESATQAIELDPKHAHAHADRGFAYLQTGKTDVALADFQEALRVAPPDWPHRAAVSERIEQIQKK